MTWSQNLRHNLPKAQAPESWFLWTNHCLNEYFMLQNGQATLASPHWVCIEFLTATFLDTFTKIKMVCGKRSFQGNIPKWWHIREGSYKKLTLRINSRYFSLLSSPVSKQMKIISAIRTIILQPRKVQNHRVLFKVVVNSSICKKNVCQVLQLNGFLPKFNCCKCWWEGHGMLSSSKQLP